jgi:hypothetical protein
VLSKVILTGYCTLASVVAAHVLAAGKVVALVTLSGRRAHTGAHEQSLIMIWLLSVGENPSTHTLFVLNGRVAYKFPVMKAVDRESRMNALDT